MASGIGRMITLLLLLGLLFAIYWYQMKIEKENEKKQLLLNKIYDKNKKPDISKQTAERKNNTIDSGDSESDRSNMSNMTNNSNMTMDNMDNMSDSDGSESEGKKTFVSIGSYSEF